MVQALVPLLLLFNKRWGSMPTAPVTCMERPTSGLLTEDPSGPLG